jgi:capsular polysaccharide biosynthesis protein
MALQGWETVTLTGMSTKKQIELFSSASHVISTHGAGLTNLLWCQLGTKVIEISQTELLEKKVYPVLSHHLGLSHYVLLGQKVPIAGDKIKGVKRKKDFNNLKLDLKLLQDLLDL